jgi:UDP-glucose 4-epimerase
MKILVTGGAGFIGSHTVVALAEAGFEPIILDNFDNAEPQVIQRLEKIIGKTVVCYHSDCTDGPTLAKILQKENIQGIIHFAAHKAVGESMKLPLKYYRNNLDSTLTLLEEMEKQGIASMVFSSSCTVYGQPDQLPVTEESPFKPAESVYGNTKQICEDILRFAVQASPTLKAIALRYFNPVGAHPSALIGEWPRGVPNNLVPLMTQAAVGIRSQLAVFGNDYPTPDGSCIRDYIHVMDLAQAHVSALHLLLKTEGSLYETFNIGTGQGHSVLHLIKTFEKVTQQSLNYQIAPRRSGDVVAVYADPSKSNRMLNWYPQRTLEDALADAWRWQLKLMEEVPS